LTVWGMSWWRTPRWWLSDLATQAKLNEKFYTHRLGCWCAAMGDRLPKRRGGQGNRFGSMLLRLPLAKWSFVLLALAAIPGWWRWTTGQPGDFRREYQLLYFATWFDGTVARWVNPAAMDLLKRLEPSDYQGRVAGDGMVSYPVWLVGDMLAENSGYGARLIKVPVNPERLHAWLMERIYRGSIWVMYGEFLAGSLGTLIGFWILGRLADWRRRVKAMDGIFRRGMRMVNLKRWNRKSIGPWWRRRKLGMVVRVGTGGGLAKVSAQAMTTHMLNMGKTGGGKTTLVNMMLDIAEREDWVVICSDAKREILRSRYSEPRGDWAIDPGLAICPKWAVQRECRDINEARALAAGVFPEGPGEMGFFTDWAQKGLAWLLSQYSEANAPRTKHPQVATTHNLGRWLGNPEKHITPRIKGAGIAAAMNPKSGDQSAGVEGSFARASDAFLMMPTEASREFCIREWIDALNRGEQPGWVIFPTGGPTEKAVKPVVTAMLEMLLLRLRDSASLGLPRRQILVVLDEITTSFNRLNELVTALTNLRSFGVFVVVGVHDCSALSGMYGQDSARTILGQPGLKAIYGTNDPHSAEYASDTVGKAEYWRLKENFPGKPLDTHRSLNFNLDLVETPLITRDEIMALDPLQGVLVNEGFAVRFHLSYRPSGRKLLDFEERIIPMRTEEDDEEDEPAKKTPVPLCDGEPAVPYDVVKDQVEAIVQAKRLARLLMLRKGAEKQMKRDLEVVAR
jgi:type IV secretory pathway TraG/TraD family ATPase VirD4